LIKQQVYSDNQDVTFLFPYEKGNLVSYFMENSTVIEQEYLENGVRLVVNCHKEDVDKYNEYLI
jgi:GTP-binding protein HflX